MLNSRQKQILQILREDKKVEVSNLATIFKVTEASIRLDLTKMENTGLLRRFYGGARSIESTDYHERIEKNLDVKKQLAERALKYIENGETLFFDSGTTILQLSKIVTSLERLTIVTNSLSIAAQVGPETDKNIILVGGALNFQEQCCSGSMTDTALESIYTAKAFIGADSVDISNGILSTGLDRVGYIRKVMEHTKTLFLIVDSGKFSKTGVVKIANISDIDVIITDSNLPLEIQKELESKGINVDIVNI